MRVRDELWLFSSAVLENKRHEQKKRGDTETIFTVDGEWDSVDNYKLYHRLFPRLIKPKDLEERPSGRHYMNPRRKEWEYETDEARHNTT